MTIDLLCNALAPLAAAGSSTRACEHRHFLFDAIAQAILLNFQIISRLHVQPDPIGSLEVPRQSQGGIGRDGPSAVDDLVDASRWHAKVFREAVLADAQWLNKVFEQDLAWVKRRQFLLTFPGDLTFPDRQCKETGAPWVLQSHIVFERYQTQQKP